MARARFPSRRLPPSVRRRLEVATAMAWESLVDAHVGNTLHFLTLLRDRLPFEEALGRYLAEMDLTESMATTVRTRALVNLESGASETDAQQTLPLADAATPEAGAGADGWRRFRPDVMVREVRQRQRRNDEIEGIIQLAIARAEEGVITTHVDNAITFAALLEEFLPLARAVQHYIGAVALSGGRAQAVYQRTMARLADVHLPRASATRPRVDG
jgi:hypothetical protein